jgi:hypothetical protein
MIRKELRPAIDFARSIYDESINILQIVRPYNAWIAGSCIYNFHNEMFTTGDLDVFVFDDASFDAIYNKLKTDREEVTPTGENDVDVEYRFLAGNEFYHTDVAITVPVSVSVMQTGSENFPSTWYGKVQFIKATTLYADMTDGLNKFDFAHCAVGFDPDTMEYQEHESAWEAIPLGRLMFKGVDAINAKRLKKFLRRGLIADEATQEKARTQGVWPENLWDDGVREAGPRPRPFRLQTLPVEGAPLVQTYIEPVTLDDRYELPPAQEGYLRTHTYETDLQEQIVLDNMENATARYFTRYPGVGVTVTNTTTTNYDYPWYAPNGLNRGR